MDVPRHTIVIWSEIHCPWSHLAVHRLHETRARLGLDDVVAFDHRAFPLEYFNERGTPKRILDAEIPVVGALDPTAGWRMWQGRDSDYPSTTMLAMEAVQAAKEQGLEASAQLDRALRRAFFVDSRPISLRHEILAVAADCTSVDAGALSDALDAGRSRREVIAQAGQAQRAGVEGSPHLFLPDGTDVHNPGIDKEWVGEPGTGFPVVRADDPSVYDDIVKQAA